jgi:hypothetical protein
MNVLMLERGHTRIIHVVNNFLAEWYVDLKVDGLLITCPQSVLLVLLVKLPINFLRLRFLSLLLLSLLYFLISLIWCLIVLLWRWLLLLILKGQILVLE